VQDKRVFRSVSQLKEYKQCPQRYYLHRIKKVWEKPAAWLPQGLGVHEAAEAYEKSGRTMSLEETQEVFIDSYAKHTNRLMRDTPNLGYWFRSGGFRRTVAEDIERRFGLGLEQTAKYLAWYESHPLEVIWVDVNGTVGIELPFEFEIDGVWVRGYIDQIVWDPIKKRWVVRDIKTGKSPGDDLQLATYRHAVNEQFDLGVDAGDYWMGVSGKPTVEYDLTYWTTDLLAEEFRTLDEDVKAERFDPLPEKSKCMFCSVSDDCDFSLA
jgi:putative RecB family exonuclease